MRKLVLYFCIVVLILIVMPASGMAVSLSASSQASILWDSISFSSTVNWLDPTGADTRGSFSAAAVGLNTPADPYSGVDYIDGAPWGNTTATQSFADATGNASGSAYTSVPALPTLTQQYASASLLLTQPGFASIDIAQAVLSGQFTVPAATSLNISAAYHVEQFLANDLDINGSASVSSAVGLRLANADNDSPFTSDELLFSQLLTGLGSPSNFIQDGTLNLAWNLVPGITYDFESQASVTALGTVPAPEPVPEPATILLIGSGIIGLVRFRKG